MKSSNLLMIWVYMTVSDNKMIHKFELSLVYDASLV